MESIKKLEQEAIHTIFERISDAIKKPSSEWEKKDFSLFLKTIELEIIAKSGIKTIADFRNVTKENHKSKYNLNNILLRKISMWQGLIEEYDESLYGINQIPLEQTVSVKHLKFEDVPKIIPKNSMQESMENIPFNAEETCILLKYEFDEANYPIPTAGGKFGRSPENDIVLLDSDISRKHAEIFFMDNKFYLKDLKSCMGTLFRINSPVVLEKNMKFEIGNYYTITIEDVKGLKLKLKVENENDEDYENEKAQELDFGKIGIQKGVIIGKSQESHIKLQAKKKSKIEDKHCMIYCNEKNEIVLEDQHSEAGTWLFLDQIPKELHPKMQFRLGERNVFLVLKIFLIQKSNIHLLPEGTEGTPNPNEEDIKGFNESDDLCIICCDNPKNGTLLPCKHNFMCVKCSQGLRICPMCRKKIEGILEIRQ